jgi:hypothetical protein
MTVTRAPSGPRMIALKRVLYWILAGCAILLMLLGVGLTLRVVFSSSRANLGDLLEVPVVFARLLLDFAKEKPAEFLLGLASTIGLFVIGLWLLRYLAQTAWERRRAPWFMILGITGALLGAGAVFVAVIARLAGA